MIDLIKTKEIETHLADLPKYDKETQQKIIDILNLLNGLAKSQKIETESIDLKLTYIKEDGAQIDYTLKIRKNLIKSLSLIKRLPGSLLICFRIQVHSSLYSESAEPGQSRSFYIYLFIILFCKVIHARPGEPILVSNGS